MTARRRFGFGGGVLSCEAHGLGGSVRRVGDLLAAAVIGKMEAATGGPARLRVILLLAGVLALSSADAATVGAVAAELERSLRLSNTEVGLLVTVSVGVGALATLPAGVLADRVERVRLLWVSVLVWALAMTASALATSFAMLLFTRLALGAVVATAYPVTASLTGDLFPSAERGRVYGYILTGELAGTGLGFLISGDLAGAFGWRAGFLWLAVPSLALAWALRRYLPEPARGGKSRLPEGATRIMSAEQVRGASPAGRRTRRRYGRDSGTGDAPARIDQQLAEMIEEQRVAPHAALVLREDPTRRSLWWSVRFTLSIRTNLILIVASGLGYFFLQGLQTFAVVYLRGRYGLGQSAASTLLVVLGLGAIVGVLVSGAASDQLLHRGHLTARISSAGAAFLLAAALFLPGLIASSLATAAPLLFLAAAGLGATNPPLNAARLDLVHSRVWGRAEGVRNALSTALQAPAPLLFGYVSTMFGGHAAGLAQASSQKTASATGLQPTFLLMLTPLLAAAGLLLVRARRTYPRDVASAIASEEATRPPSPEPV